MTNNSQPPTFFLTPDRAGADLLIEQIALTSNNPVIDGVMKSAGGLLAVLNEQRQVLSLNDCLLRNLGIDDADQLLGLRLGEMIRCENAAGSPSGCGTTRYCTSCGAAVAMAACLENGQPADQKCILTVQRNDQSHEMVLQVHAAMIDIGQHRCLLLFMQDITSYERNAFLERMFLHDLNNLISGLGGVSEALVTQLGTDQREIGDIILNLTRRLTREMEIQRAVYQDHTTGFNLFPERIVLHELLAELRGTLSRHPVTYGKELSLGALDSELSLQSDPSLLLRVLLNMLINAFEATDPGGMVRLWVKQADEQLVFNVWNRAAIPREIRSRLFQLYFSTRQGSGRGIGTYVMKLLTESYLGGQLDFDSSEARGTTFRLALPVLKRSENTQH